jgi:hypothetical protein
MNRHFRPDSVRAIPASLMRPAAGRAARTDEGHVALGDILAPETPLTVEIVGLSPEAQRALLAGFPGGARFRIKGA